MAGYINGQYIVTASGTQKRIPRYLPENQTKTEMLLKMYENRQATYPAVQTTEIKSKSEHFETSSVDVDFPYELDNDTGKLPYEQFYETKNSTIQTQNRLKPFGVLTTDRSAQHENIQNQRRLIFKNNFQTKTIDTPIPAPLREGAENNIKNKKNVSSPEQVKTSNPFSNEVSFNGKLDRDFRQGTAGDCWLLSAIEALKDRPSGKKYLESLLVKNESNGTISVNLKKPDATYTFSKQDIADATNFSTGDPDVRAMEMAIERHIDYLQANGKYNQSRNSMVTGDNAINAWKFLLGEQGMYAANRVSNFTLFSEEYDNYDDVINDYNNPNKVFTFAIKNKNIEETLAVENQTFPIEDTSTGEQSHLYYNHAYSVVSSDDSYVYFKNPHDTSKIYRCARNLLEQHNARIEVGKIPK